MDVGAEVVAGGGVEGSGAISDEISGAVSGGSGFMLGGFWTAIGVREVRERC